MTTNRRGHGEGSIYQRASDERWAASITLSGGKRKHFLGHTRADVARKLAIALKSRMDGLPMLNDQVTTARFLEDWLTSAKTSLRPRSYENYDLNVRRLTPLIGKLKLSNLSPAHVQRAYGALLDQGLSRRSVEQVHTVLHNALRQAVKWGLLGRNPTDAVNVPRPVKGEMKTLSQEEALQLFDATSEHRLHALWKLLVTSGLRIGEATALRWSDIDFSGGRLTVRRALQRQKERGLTFVEPKTARSRRTVYLAQATLESLREHRIKQLAEQYDLGPAWQDQDLVFCRADGSPLDPSQLSKELTKILTKAGLPHVRVHDLRHTAATILLQEGVHPKIVQELLGHSTITLTLDTYSHVSPVMHAEVATKMDALFGRS